MGNRDPERTFEALWKIFWRRYPFFELRGVDWQSRYAIYRPKVTAETSDRRLFDICCAMLAPLDDGHVELLVPARGDRRKRYFNPEKKPRFWQEFSDAEIRKLFKTTEKTLVANGFGRPRKTRAWMLRYSRSPTFAYLRVLELEGVGRRKLTAALDEIAHDFESLRGVIIDVRDCPGGDDSTGIAIVNRFCDRRRVAFRRKTKIGPGKHDFTPLKTWYLEPEGDSRFRRPIALLTCDSVFSGGESFVLAMRQLPHVTIIGDHTNGIFSYQLEKRLPNGWEVRLSHQVYLSADRVCYEGIGVPPDIRLLNTRADIEKGVDPLIVRALDVLTSGGSVSPPGASEAGR